MIFKSYRKVLASLVVLALFSVAPAFGSTFTVTNTADSGLGSLRDSIAAANLSAGADTIVFDAGVTGTITLLSGQLTISDDLTITGPGASSLAISGGGASRVFHISGGSTVVGMSGVTIRDGSAPGGSWPDDAGGGMFIEPGNTVSLTHSTVSGNSVGDFGGGIFNAGTMTLTHSTVSGNSTAYGDSGGIYNEGTVTLKNTIVANNTSGGNCTLIAGTAASQGHNLSDDTSCTFFIGSDQIVLRGGAGLGPLQNNGGPTETHALLPPDHPDFPAGSPAIDAIPTSPDNFCTAVDGVTPITTDQRGFLRPSGSACDIGAYEFVPAPPTDSLRPLTSGVQASPSPVAIHVGTTLTANVDDSTTGGSNIASAEYTIDGGSPIPMNATVGGFDSVSEDVTASVAPFAETGVYSLCVHGTDAPGNVGDPVCTYLPVYDPTGGFVTGGGIVNSPASADLTNDFSGPATFGFVSKYLPGRSTPDGNLEFQFKAGSLNFKSTSMDWLVVTGEPRGQFQGTGTINGGNVCKFAVDAWDASYSVSNVDAFGLKIFACGAGGDRYSLDAAPLTKGSIIIHK